MQSKQSLEGARSQKYSGRVMVVLLAILFAAMPLMSFDFGITCDEPDHYDYGQLTLDFYTSGFSDRSSFDYKWNYLNGALFDMAATLAQKAFPEVNPYTVRHVCNAYAGWLGILVTGLLARRLFGSWAGPLAVVFMALTPRWMGHAMNNPKDVPFAAAYAFVLYAFTFVRHTYPFVTWKSASLIVGAVALLMSVRAGGLVVIGYAGLYLGVLVLRDRQTWNPVKMLKIGAVFAGGVAVALCLGAAFWPWALDNPFLKPLEALRIISDYPWVGVVYMNGVLYRESNLPWHYIPWMYLVTTPMSVLVGFAASPWLMFRRSDRWKTAALFFVIIFPIAWVILTKAVLYNGVRHLLFIMPPLVVLAAGSWSGIFELVRTRWKHIILTLLLILGLAHAVLSNIRYYPYLTLYFNEFTGGVSGAVGKYDMDYWGNSYKEALERVKERHPEMERPIKIFSPHLMCGAITRAYARFDPRLEFVEEEDYPTADYIVTLNLLLQDDVLRSLMLMPGVEVVAVAGYPLCVIDPVH